MKINTSNWNKLRYTWYTPIYDFVVQPFTISRKKSIQALNIEPGSKVLIAGAGTGLDLHLIPSQCHVVAIDITPSMVREIKKRNSKLNKNVQALVMDAQDLAFRDNSFDYIVLHLILAVMPNPEKCLQECERVLKAQGRIAVFDKFLPKKKSVSFFRKFVNVFTNVLFSDITRDIYTLVDKTQLKICFDKKANFKGNFRILQLRFNNNSCK